MLDQEQRRRAQIRKCVKGDDVRGPDAEWVVYLYEDGRLIERRALGNHNQYYAQDVKENWELKIIR